jgi:ubiquinone biosynthesis protein UbiJ
MTTNVRLDSTPFFARAAGDVPADTFSPAARAGLRAVAAARTDSGEKAARAAALVVADARENAVTAEHMIIAVKREWSTLDEVRRIGSGAEARAMLDRLVTLCIDAFYARR